MMTPLKSWNDYFPSVLTLIFMKNTITNKRICKTMKKNVDTIAISIIKSTIINMIR